MLSILIKYSSYFYRHFFLFVHLWWENKLCLLSPFTFFLPASFFVPAWWALMFGVLIFQTKWNLLYLCCGFPGVGNDFYGLAVHKRGVYFSICGFLSPYLGSPKDLIKGPRKMGSIWNFGPPLKYCIFHQKNAPNPPTYSHTISSIPSKNQH